MAQKVLLVGDRPEWLSDLKSSLLASNVNIQYEETSERSSCQKLLNQLQFQSIFIDPDLAGGSGVELLKYVKLNHPGTKVEFVFGSAEQGQRYASLGSRLREVGLHRTHTLPMAQLQLLTDPVPVGSEAPALTQEQGLRDMLVTAIPVDSFAATTLCLFDYYLRIKEDHYVKVFKKGEYLDPVRTANYKQKGVKCFYLKIDDRKDYISLVNRLLQESFQKRQRTLKSELSTCSRLSEMLLEEIHSRGLNDELIVASKEYCDSVAGLVKNNYRLGEINSLFLDMDISTLSHSFLVTFMSVAICKNLDWTSPKTTDAVALGALLHDIGLMLLPESIRDKDPRLMTDDELAQYEDHPRLGADLLLNNPNINPQVTQIVFQHHENNSGTGYPNRLTAVKIYPLAKIVSLAENLADSMAENLISPLDAVKLLLLDRARLQMFDPNIVKALVGCFKSAGKK